jgi:predicted AAA+ superfamily ATPase
MFLVRLLPPWHTNIGKRLVKTPKVLLTDTGLAAHLMGIDDARLVHDRSFLGGLLESFVAMELVKQAGWCVDPPALYHFRTHEGDEVDLVLERRGGAVVGIEVKSAATVSAADFKGLRALAAAAGRRFRRGIVLYTGTEIVPFGSGLFALPVEALWRWTEPAAERKKATP